MSNKDLDAILKAFKQLPKEAAKPIPKAIDKGADELVSRMQYLAPEEKGDLKASIKKHKINDFATRIQVDDEASLYQEFGTAERDSNAFFWPSVNTLKTRVRRRVDRAIGQAVKAAWGGKGS